MQLLFCGKTSFGKRVSVSDSNFVFSDLHAEYSRSLQTELNVTDILYNTLTTLLTILMDSKPPCTLAFVASGVAWPAARYAVRPNVFSIVSCKI